MLEKFRLSKQKEIEFLKKLQKSGALCPDCAKIRADFAAAMKSPPAGLKIVAEYKRASPSKGRIRSDLQVEDVAHLYEQAGASAISVLTEKDWFDGDFTYLQKTKRILENKAIPVLRKDFIFDATQILHTAQSDADAVLLIVRCLKDETELQKLLELASLYNLQCVVEVFDQEDLEMARGAGAKIIQVNARDLDNLKVNPQSCLHFIEKNPPLKEEVWIAASGLENADQLKDAKNAGYDAVLIGSSLMGSPDPGVALKNLLGSMKC